MADYKKRRIRKILESLSRHDIYLRAEADAARAAAGSREGREEREGQGGGAGQRPLRLGAGLLRRGAGLLLPLPLHRRLQHLAAPLSPPPRAPAQNKTKETKQTTGGRTPRPPRRPPAPAPQAARGPAAARAPSRRCAGPMQVCFCFVLFV